MGSLHTESSPYRRRPCLPQTPEAKPVKSFSFAILPPRQLKPPTLLKHVPRHSVTEDCPLFSNNLEWLPGGPASPAIEGVQQIAASWEVTSTAVEGRRIAVKGRVSCLKKTHLALSLLTRA